MRILFVHTRYRLPGGEDKAVELEAALLKENGHETEILLFTNEAMNERGAAQVAGLARAIYNPEAKKRTAEAIRRFRPDVVHVHNLFFVASPSILDAAAAAGVPVVATLHNFRLICCNALLLRDDKPCELCKGKILPAAGVRYRCYRGSAAASAMVTLTTGLHKLRKTWTRKVSTYIVLTEFARGKMIDPSLGVPTERFLVAPNFLPDSGEGKTEREDFFLFAGRLSKEKGIETLLAAFIQMPERRIEIAGDGPEREWLENRYGSCPNIRFLGTVDPDTLQTKMRSCRALVFPSLWYEGLPFVILESFCAGTPVIASRLGSMAEMITDGYNGRHFTAGDATDLVRIVNDFSAENRRLYTGARQTYLDRYNPAIHYRQILTIYENMIRS